MSLDFLNSPIDPVSAETLASGGLRFERVDTADAATMEIWLAAVSRGFHGPVVTPPEKLDPRRDAYRERRVSALWDDTLRDDTLRDDTLPNDGVADAATPVATASSWVADLTLPGETSIPSWAISTVTVAPTHRRRGIAKAMIGAELRTAAACGVPVAILTASEATIYERWGFAPAALRADWEIDTRRASWTGPAASGRLQLVSQEQLRDGGGLDLVERVRLSTPGQMRFDGILWTRLFGTAGDSDTKNVRCVRFDDADGVAQGFALYRVDEHEEANHHFLYRLDVKYFVSATPEAYSALWRYLLEMDLVTSVTARLRPVDEAVRWQVSDPRAVEKTDERDHLWLRILDVKAVLEARRYAAPGSFALSVSDPLGYAAGDVVLTVDEAGVGTVRPGTAGAVALSMTVNELGALSLGGISAVTMLRAGRIAERAPGAAVLFDRTFRADATPWLSIWF